MATFSLTALSRSINRPSVTISAVVLALALGVMKAPFLQLLRPVGEFYTALLQMCVLPFLLTTIPLAVRSAMTSGTVGHVMRMLVSGVIVTVLVVTLTSLLVPSLIFSNFFAVDEATLARIGSFVGEVAERTDIEFLLDPTGAVTTVAHVQGGLMSVVPTNIFASLASNDSMRVLVFVAIFGIALVLTEREAEHSAFSSMRHIQRVCILIFDWFNLLVPVGIVALIAPPVALMGSDIFKVLAMFAYAYLSVSAVVLVSAIVLVSVALRRGPGSVFASLLKPMMLGAATNNSLVCIPLALETMREDLKIPSEPCALYIPVGITTLRFGSIVYFIVATLFMGALMGRSFGVADLLLVAVFSTAASFATIGATGLAALTPLAAILRTFGLSYEVALPLMIIMDPIASIVRTVVNIGLNCAIPAATCGRASPPMMAEAAPAE